MKIESCVTTTASSSWVLFSDRRCRSKLTFISMLLVIIGATMSSIQIVSAFNIKSSFSAGSYRRYHQQNTRKSIKIDERRLTFNRERSKSNLDSSSALGLSFERGNEKSHGLFPGHRNGKNERNRSTAISSTMVSYNRSNICLVSYFHIH